MRLLDAGCGPGTITAGLARAVAPGAVVGIDVVESVLASARDSLAAGGLANCSFEAGDIYALRWADASFEAAHAHQVLQHLSRPVDALRELRRVLAPGGLLGARDADYATMIAYPDLPAINRWRELYHAIARANGAEADAGRRLPAWLRAAGFERVETTATAVLFTDPAEIENWGHSWAERVLHSNFGSQALEYGLSNSEELAELAAGWREWAASPGALFLYVNIECLAWK
jgi:ubiquinone/menaquinone biosynthesis C-methylase UbiE